MWNGLIKFNGEGEQPTRIGGNPYDGYEPPRVKVLATWTRTSGRPG